MHPERNDWLRQNMVEYLRMMAVNPENETVWGLDEVADEIERLRAKLKHACPICNDTGLNHGAQPGPGPGYRTVRCSCSRPNAEAHRKTGQEHNHDD